MWVEEFRDQYIHLELTDFCNYNCIMCCHDRPEGPHSGPSGFMSERLFRKIIDELPQVKAATGLKLFWLGEPLLNPVFPDMLTYCARILREKKSNYYIDIHTNAFLLDSRISDLLLENGDVIPRITLSLDAHTQDTYRRIRRGGDIDRVRANIKEFLIKREKSGRISPTVIFQFIVMQENADEAGDFVKYWKDTVDSVRKGGFDILGKISKLSGYRNARKIQDHSGVNRPRDVIWLKRLDCEDVASAGKLYMDTVEKFSLESGISKNLEIIVSRFNLWNPEQEEERAREKEEQPQKRTICSGPFKTPSIRWDGTLTICCFDPSMELALGNLSDNTFEELWLGSRAHRIRSRFVNGEYSKVLTHDGYQKCLNCPGLDTPFISSDEIDQWKKESGFERD